MAELIAWFSSPQGVTVLALLVPLVCSIATAVLPSGSPLMKVVDVLALSVGRAKNDPEAQ